MDQENLLIGFVKINRECCFRITVFVYILSIISILASITLIIVSIVTKDLLYVSLTLVTIVLAISFCCCLHISERINSIEEAGY